MMIIRWLLDAFDPRAAHERDAALIVSFLAERGPEDVLGLRIWMKDHTRGEHDWMFKSERRIYRILDRLEAEGAIAGGARREYRLVAPRERLVIVR